MIYLSEILSRHTDLQSFDQLSAIIRKLARDDDSFELKLDIKPNFGDTPTDWKELLMAICTPVAS